jgi:hypothetical protein
MEFFLSFLIFPDVRFPVQLFLGTEMPTSYVLDDRGDGVLVPVGQGFSLLLLSNYYRGGGVFPSG